MSGSQQSRPASPRRAGPMRGGPMGRGMGVPVQKAQNFGPSAKRLLAHAAHRHCRC